VSGSGDEGLSPITVNYTGVPRLPRGFLSLRLIPIGINPFGTWLRYTDLPPNRAREPSYIKDIRLLYYLCTGATSVILPLVN
jgi:hypothetical protein